MEQREEQTDISTRAWEAFERWHYEAAGLPADRWAALQLRIHRHTQPSAPEKLARRIGLLVADFVSSPRQPPAMEAVGWVMVLAVSLSTAMRIDVGIVWNWAGLCRAAVVAPFGAQGTIAATERIGTALDAEGATEATTRCAVVEGIADLLYHLQRTVIAAGADPEQVLLDSAQGILRAAPPDSASQR